MHAEEVRWTFLERERGFVVVHRYINNDCHIVLDVNSGSVHIVDEIVYDAVGLLEDKLSFEETAKILSEKYALEEVESALEECRELKEEGMLFTEDIYKDAISHFKERETVVKAL